MTFPSGISVTTLQLLPNKSLGISAESPLVLGSHPAADFSNPVMRLRKTGNSIEIFSEGATTNFPEMAAQRSATRNLDRSPESILGELSERNGKRMSNIGISLAMTTTLEGERYAVLVHRAADDRLMLLSGYLNANRVDQASTGRALVTANMLGELREELLPVGQDGRVETGVVLGSMAREVARELVIATDDFMLHGTGESVTGIELGEGYPALNYDQNPHFRLRWSGRMPRYLPNVHHIGDFNLDGSPFSAGLQYGQQWNAGQIFVPLELELGNLSGMNVYHAEDRLNMKTKTELVTMLDRNGIVFVKLDSQGQLTDQMYNLHGGALQAIKSENPELRKLSEAFAPSPIPGVRGFVNQSDVLFRDRAR
jgi:hypothetical protein